MKKLLTAFGFVFLLFSVNVSAQTDADREAIKRAALNYAEGWYEGDAAKMESALHPDLAKRIAITNDNGRSRLDQMSALTLIQATRGGFGKNTPKEQQQKDVTILDVFGNAATVRLEMRDWIDYMHLAKFNGRWVIVNVLWERKPPKEQTNPEPPADEEPPIVGSPPPPPPPVAPPKAAGQSSNSSSPQGEAKEPERPKKP